MSVLYGSPSHTNQSVTLQLLPSIPPSTFLFLFHHLRQGMLTSLNPLFFHEHNLLYVGGWQIILAIEFSYTVQNCPICALSWKEKGYMGASIKCWANENCWEAEIISTWWVIHWHGSLKDWAFFFLWVFFSVLGTDRISSFVPTTSSHWCAACGVNTQLVSSFFRRGMLDINTGNYKIRLECDLYWWRLCLMKIWPLTLSVSS